MPTEGTAGGSGEATGDDDSAPAVLGTWLAAEAMLIAGRLRSEGIDAIAETEGSDLVPAPVASGPVRVLVSADQLEQAQRILAGIEDE